MRQLLYVRHLCFTFVAQQCHIKWKTLDSPLALPNHQDSVLSYREELFLQLVHSEEKLFNNYVRLELGMRTAGLSVFVLL